MEIVRVAHIDPATGICSGFSEGPRDLFVWDASLVELAEVPDVPCDQLCYRDGVWIANAARRVTRDMVDAERDRRIDAGMTFDGKRFQTRPQDRENITGASINASLATINGIGLPHFYRWHGEATDFVWILEDNTTLRVDAPAMIRIGKALAAHKSRHIFAARTLKDADPIPADYADDLHWP